MILELLEPKRQPVPIRTILTPPPRLNHLPDDSLKPEFEESAIMDFEQPIRDVNFGNRGRRGSGGRRRRHDGFCLWQRVYGPEPAEEPLPGTVKGMGIEVGIKRDCASGIVPRCRPERLREPLRSPIYPRRDCRMSLTSSWMRKSSLGKLTRGRGGFAA
jgi:hypothetical protein